MATKVSTKQIAPIIGVSPATLESWRSRKNPHQPPYYVVSGRIVYDVEECERFMACRRVCK